MRVRRLRKEFGVGVVASWLPCCVTAIGTVKPGASTRNDGFPAVILLDGYEAIVPCRLLTRSIAKRFVAEVEEARGPIADATCNTKTKLVETKLEMVRTAGLFDNGAAFSGIRWINTRDRLQRDEID